MAFLAEDGTGLAEANSLCDVAFADAYFDDRNVVTWAGTDPAKQAALVRATDYVESRFSGLFKGVRNSDLQGLSFPRDATTEVPVGIKKAIAEYALRALTGTTLLPDPVIDPSGVGVERTRKKVGPIEKETRYQIQGPGAARMLFRPYPAADSLIRPFLKITGGVIRG